MEINVGDYVRTSNNINNPSFVAKIIKIENKKMIFEGLGLWITFDNKKEGFYENIITKHSKDIIDLVEVGDYANGMMVTRISGTRWDDKDLHCYCDNNHSNDTRHKNIMISSKDIKSVLTKEQFESNAYTIEKEK